MIRSSTQPVAQPSTPRPPQQEKSDGADSDPTATLLPSYTAQAVGNTVKAFVIPTLASGLLPPPMRSAVYVPAGVTYADLRRPQAIAHSPAPDTRTALTATALGLAPFLPLLTLQTRFAHSDLRVGRVIQQAWDRLAARLPQQVRLAMARYPINQLLARAVAQMASAASGAVLSNAYMVQVAQTQLVSRSPQELAELAAHSTTAHKAGTCVAGAALFSVPALVANPAMATLVPGWAALPPSAKTAVVTSLLIGAALATTAVARREAGGPGEPLASGPWDAPLPADTIDAAVAELLQAGLEQDEI